MKTAVIYYFSGTGNTELVADMVRAGLEKNDYKVDVLRIEDILKSRCEINPENYDLVGIGSQVIGYGVPCLVRDFIKALPAGNEKKVFIFRTAGGVAPINYNASKPIIGKLKRKGYDVFHERVFSISSNWIVRFDDRIVQQLYEATGKKVGLMCEELARGEKRILKTSIWLRLAMTPVIAGSTTLLRLVGKDILVSNECVHCGLCVRNCPAGNIYEKEGRIRFGLSCNSCMRCVYSCPRKAMSFKRLGFFAVPGGYDIRAILGRLCCSPEEGGDRVPPFFNEYLQNNEM